MVASMRPSSASVRWVPPNTPITGRSSTAHTCSTMFKMPGWEQPTKMARPWGVSTAMQISSQKSSGTKPCAVWRTKRSGMVSKPWRLGKLPTSHRPGKGWARASTTLCSTRFSARNSGPKPAERSV